MTYCYSQVGAEIMLAGSVMQQAAIRVKMPAVAGLFYPEDREALRQEVDDLLAEGPERPGILPRALIAPHAGYIYSGSVAAAIYRQLRPLAERLRRVVLLGPAHRVGFSGIAIPGDGFFRTPLGDVPLERAALQRLLQLPFVMELERAFSQEHCLEVQLPFLQRLLPHFELIPLLVGQASYQQVQQVIEQLAGGPETLIVISSDLSHFHPYQEAQRLDAQTTAAIEQLDAAGLDHEHACGRIPVGGLLQYARHKGLSVVTLDQRNSGDTAGSKERVVGYGAYAFIE
jgi:hypothetical protein